VTAVCNFKNVVFITVAAGSTITANSVMCNIFLKTCIRHNAHFMRKKIYAPPEVYRKMSPVSNLRKLLWNLKIQNILKTLFVSCWSRERATSCGSLIVVPV